ncbi:MAG: hypothetical protein ABUS56_03550 [Acidobacteriota bacterium]
MPDLHVRSDSVNVEQIMEQIRARIREKRGVDYTEQQIRELAAVKLEKFLDPRGVRSDLLAQFRQNEADPNYAFESDTLFETHRGPLRWMRRVLSPVLKLFFNPNPLIHVLHMQSDINDRNTRRNALYYELVHNLVLEVTQLGIEVKNLKMRTETLTSRVEFSERRARALEGAVLYRPPVEERLEAAPPVQPSPPAAPTSYAVPALPPLSTPTAPAAGPGTTGTAGVGAAGAAVAAEGPGQRSRRRRRRRGRRGGASATAIMGGPAAGGDGAGETPAGSGADDSADDLTGPAESDDEQ